MKVMLLLILVCSFVANAAIESHVVQDKKIKIDVPKEWQAVKDLYGLPLVVLGPWENESRPAITWMFTGMTTKIMKKDDLAKIFKDFKEDKEAWVKEHAGKLVKFEPLTDAKYNPGLHGSFVGAEFVINDVHFVERSYYLYCNDEVFNVKYSIRDEHRKYLKSIDGIIGSLKCE